MEEMDNDSLMKLAFQGEEQTTDDATMVELSDPELFNQGIIEHARYLGMDPEVDEQYLWIAKESLVAPVPEGWTQEATSSGAPYYFNEETGESRWEHPMDREYTQMFLDTKKRDEEAASQNEAGWDSSRQFDTQEGYETFDQGAEQEWTEEPTYPAKEYANTSRSEYSEYGEVEPYTSRDPAMEAPSTTKKSVFELNPQQQEIRTTESSDAAGNEMLLSKLDEQRNKCNQLSKSVSILEDEKHELLKHLSEAKSALEASEVEIQEMKSTKGSVSEQDAEEKAVLEGKLSDLRKENKKLNNSIEEMQNKLEIALSDKREAHEKVADLEARVNNAGSASEKQLLSLEKELKELQESMDSEIAAKDALSDKMSTLEQEVVDKADQIDKLKKSLDTEFSGKQKNDEEQRQRDEELMQLVETSQEQIVQLEAEMDTMKQKMKNVSKDHEKELSEADEQIKKLKQSSVELEQEIDTVNKKSQSIQDEADMQAKKVSDLESELRKEEEALSTRLEDSIKKTRAAVEKECLERVKTAVQDVEKYKALFSAEMVKRKELHNKIMEIQGNIRVFCRVRPVGKAELKTNQTSQVVSFNADDKQALDLVVGENSERGASYHSFEFEHVFQPTSTQPEVFAEISSLVVSAMDGYNVCVFAYGQTGSGKTHTMEGPKHDRGVNFRAMTELFRVRDERSVNGHVTYELKVSMLEVYNECIVDLLGDTNDAKSRSLDVRVGKRGCYVENLIEVEVFSDEDVAEIMQLGNSHRSVGSHDANEHSSRSHLVFEINIEATNTENGKITKSKLNLIDLAGSERISKTSASGQRLKEAQNINKSLSALGDVIAALGSNSKHVPYRNSKLTFLLQDSLSGHSKVLMFVNVSPVQWNAPETLCSLNFASRCRSISLGQAKCSTPKARQPRKIEESKS